MSNGVWKKYAKMNGMGSEKSNSYDELYNDLKDSGKDWKIVGDYEECKNELCSEYVLGIANEAGNVYVYYSLESGAEFYIKVLEYNDWDAKERRNYVEINGRCVGFDDLDGKHVPILIEKLREMDEVKNQEYIRELKVRYEEDERIRRLAGKIEFTEEELLFIYHMACIKGSVVAQELISCRDIQSDYDSLSQGGKVRLFLSVRMTDLSSKLFIDSKEVLMALARQRCLQQFENMSEEVLSDKDFVMSLLMEFFDADEKRVRSSEFAWYLPNLYQGDGDVLSLALYKSEFTSITLVEWMRSNPQLREEMNKPYFARRLVDSFIRGLVSRGEVYSEGNLMDCLSTEVLRSIDEYLLMGPELTELEEKLKLQSWQGVKREKENVLRLRYGNKEGK